MKINFRKREIAWLYFYPKGKGKAKLGYVLHHIDINLKNKDIKRYKEWRIEDLVMITLSDHIKLHHTGKHKSEKSKQKSSFT